MKCHCHAAVDLRKEEVLICKTILLGYNVSNNNGLVQNVSDKLIKAIVNHILFDIVTNCIDVFW